MMKPIVGCLLIFAPLMLAVQPLHAQKATVEALTSTELTTVSGAIASQQKIDALDNEAGRLIIDYRRLQARLERLASRKKQLQQRLSSQSKEQSSLKRQQQLVPTDNQVTTLLQRMIEALEAFVRADLPFHSRERLTLAAALRGLLQQPDITPAEKMRRVLKAYQDELVYGRTIEAYEGELAVGNDKAGERRLVTFLRYGRVSLVYQTFDGKETALWDRRSRSWKPLNGRFGAEVKQGIRIALKRVPPDMMIVPVQAAGE